MDNSQHHVAVLELGASPKPARYANQCICLLKQHGYRITPVHPRFEDIEDPSRSRTASTRSPTRSTR